MDEDTVIVTLRAIDGGSVIEGSVLAECEECEAAVWLAPTAQERVRNGAGIMCIQCARKQNLEMPHPADISDAQLDEIARHLGYHLSREEVIEGIKDFLTQGDT